MALETIFETGRIAVNDGASEPGSVSVSITLHSCDGAAPGCAQVNMYAGQANIYCFMSPATLRNVALQMSRAAAVIEAEDMLECRRQAEALA